VVDMTTVIRAAEPRDLIAYAWYAMGLRPRESLVVVGLRGERRRTGLVARIDLPDRRTLADEVDVVVRMLEQDGDDACLLLVVSDAEPPPGDRLPHVELVEGCRDLLADREIEIVDAFLVDRRTYRSYLCADPSCCPPDGRPLDGVAESRVAAAMVLEGRSVVGDEADLVADVDPAAAIGRGEVPLVLPRGRVGRARRLAAFQRWCADLDAGAVEPDRPEELLAALRSDLATRDAVLLSLVPGSRVVAQGLVDGRPLSRDAFAGLRRPPEPEVVASGNRLLAVLARRAPGGRRAEPLALIAWLAWWSGDCVRGRLVAELALAEQPGHRLAGLACALLAEAVPPPWTRAGRRMPARRRDRMPGGADAADG
jgi:hypothetical protein